MSIPLSRVGLVLALFACAGCSTTRPPAQSPEAPHERFTAGMSRAAVLAEAGRWHAGQLATFSRSEIHQTPAGLVEVLFFHFDGPGLDGAPIPDDAVPVILRDGRVIGTGHGAWERLRAGRS